MNRSRADNITIKVVERYDEYGFVELAEPIFGDLARVRQLESMLSADEVAGMEKVRAALPAALRIRVGAFADSELIGWSHGWFEPSGEFYVASSAVVPEFRRHGIYSDLARAIVAEASKRGCGVIRSRHRAVNNAVLIAKLKLGFVITGTEYSEVMGLLVKLSFFVSSERSELFAKRSGPLQST